MHYLSLFISLVALIIFSGQLILSVKAKIDGIRRICLALYFITLIIWQFAGFGVILSRTAASAEFFYRIYMPASTGFIYFFLPLSFSIVRNKYSVQVTVITLIFFSISIFLNFHLNLIDELYPGEGGFFVPVLNSRMIYLNLPSMVFFMLGVMNSLSEIKKTGSVLLKQRLFYFLLSSLLILFGLMSNLTILRDYPIDILCSMLGGIILAYAILMKRLLDFKKIFFRGALRSTMFTAAIGAFVLFSFLFTTVSGKRFQYETVLAAFLTLLITFFFFFRSRAAGAYKSVGRLISFGAPVYEYSMEAFSSRMRKEHEMGKIFRLLEDTLSADFPLSGMIIHLLKPESDELIRAYSGGGIEADKYSSNVLKNRKRFGELFNDANLLIPTEIDDEGDATKSEIIRNEYNGMLPDIILIFRINNEVIGIAAVFMQADNHFFLDRETIDYIENIAVNVEDAVFRAYAYERLEQDVFNRDNLIKDINHRVKNNLQMIIGLLSMQGISADRPEIKEAMATACTRVSTIAKIHEMLYVDGVVASINLKEYINEIVKGFKKNSFGDTAISFRVDVPDVAIETEKALAICLAVNELLSNSIKYAFHGKTAGVITLSIRLEDGRLICLISDDGIGIPDDCVYHGGRGIGHRLVRSFVEKQLKGSWEIQGGKGTEHRILIPVTFPD